METELLKGEFWQTMINTETATITLFAFENRKRIDILIRVEIRVLTEININDSLNVSSFAILIRDKSPQKHKHMKME